MTTMTTSMPNGTTDKFDKLVVAAEMLGVKSLDWYCAHTLKDSTGRMRDFFNVNKLGFRQMCQTTDWWARLAVEQRDEQLAITVCEMREVEGQYGQS